MTTSHDAGREAIARMIALAGLGTITGQPREPHGEWTREDFEARILTIIPTQCEQQCFALADRILESTRPPAQAGAASVEVIGADVRAHLILDNWDKHRDAPTYWSHLPTWVKEYATECVAATERRLSATPAASGEIPGGTDLPDRFEAWWATHRQHNRTLATYADKKQIAWDAYSAALSTPKASAETPIPQGWKLVPVEPTEDMWVNFDAFNGDKYMGYQTWLKAYADMLSAAPSAPATEAGEEAVSTLRSAVRRILARCEAIEDENSDQLAKEQTEAASGFLRGERHLAKSIRRELHDLTRTALSATPTDQVKDAGQGGGA